MELHPGDEANINFGILASPAYRVTGVVSGVPKDALVAEITLSSKNQGMEQAQQLGADGKFEFRNILPGYYTASVVLATGSAANGASAMQMMRILEPIQVSSANLDGVRLQLAPPQVIRGRVRMDTGQSFDWTQLEVLLLPVDEPHLGVALGVGLASGATMSGVSGAPGISAVSKNGSFELKDVPAGKYQLEVVAKTNTLSDYFLKSVYVDGRDVSDSGFGIDAPVFVDAVLSAKGATIAGTVLDSKGKAVPYASVVTLPSGEHRARVDLRQQDTANESGQFSLRGVMPGKYTVLAFDALETDVRQPEFFDAYEGRGETVQVDEGARIKLTLQLITTGSEAQ